MINSPIVTCERTRPALAGAYGADQSETCFGKLAEFGPKVVPHNSQRCAEKNCGRPSREFSEFFSSRLGSTEHCLPKSRWMENMKIDFGSSHCRPMMRAINSPGNDHRFSPTVSQFSRAMAKMPRESSRWLTSTASGRQEGTMANDEFGRRFDCNISAAPPKP
ncbi:MAG: hypothetical protein WA177_18260 [Xanthobacteraceae bacterium]